MSSLERAIPEASRAPRWLTPFTVFTVVFFVAAQAIALAISPPDRDMAHLQKIMYVHVPSAWAAFIAFFVTFCASIAYLVGRREKHDMLAYSAAEVGVVLTGLTLALGSIWGRPTWGVWWTWDPRLTSTLILFMIFCGYLALRAFTEDEDKRGRWSAVVGIFGFLNVPIVYMSVQWWRTIHQIQSTPSTVDGPYVIGLRLNAFAFLFIMITFIGWRLHAARRERALEARLEEEALAVGGVHV
jgi:heme exporter protein C